MDVIWIKKIEFVEEITSSLFLAYNGRPGAFQFLGVDWALQ